MFKVSHMGKYCPPEHGGMKTYLEELCRELGSRPGQSGTLRPLAGAMMVG